MFKDDTNSPPPRSGEVDGPSGDIAQEEVGENAPEKRDDTRSSPPLALEVAVLTGEFVQGLEGKNSLEKNAAAPSSPASTEVESVPNSPEAPETAVDLQNELALYFAATNKNAMNAAFGKLYAELKGKIEALARRFERDPQIRAELVQHAWTCLIARKESGKDAPDDLFMYLYVVMKHRAIDHGRKKNKVDLILTTLANWAAGRTRAIDSTLEVEQLIEQALDSLDEMAAMVWVLRHPSVGGLDSCEVASVMEINIERVYALQHKATVHIKAYLSKHR